MSTIQAANKVLHGAEAALRGLMQQAIQEQRYTEVAAIAALADGISRLTSSGIPAHGNGAAVYPSVPSVQSNHSATRKGRSANFPRFVRDDDRIIKIGWSKKSRSEYEHRAPWIVVPALVAAIRAKARDGELFAATDVIPLGSGNDTFPDYQAYLALKWLHSEGIVTKRGRDRYTIEPGRLGPKGLDEIWNRLPTVNGGKTRGSK